MASEQELTELQKASSAMANFITREILLRLRRRLDADTYLRVCAALALEDEEQDGPRNPN